MLLPWEGSQLDAISQTSGGMSQRHPFVRLSTSLRPDLPGGRAPSASVVPDAAPRHQREPARSVLDDASTVL